MRAPVKPLRVRRSNPRCTRRPSPLMWSSRHARQLYPHLAVQQGALLEGKGPAGLLALWEAGGGGP
eukprot:6764745-Prymnesium_polylepis.2